MSEKNIINIQNFNKNCQFLQFLAFSKMLVPFKIPILQEFFLKKLIFLLKSYVLIFKNLGVTCINTRDRSSWITRHLASNNNYPSLSVVQNPNTRIFLSYMHYNIAFYFETTSIEFIKFGSIVYKNKTYAFSKCHRHLKLPSSPKKNSSSGTN